MISHKTKRVLKRSGFISLMDTPTKSVWIVPFSGRVCIISDLPILGAYNERYPFKGIWIPTGLHDAVISNLMGQINETEHPLIDTILNNE